MRKKRAVTLHLFGDVLELARQLILGLINDAEKEARHSIDQAKYETLTFIDALRNVAFAILLQTSNLTLSFVNEIQRKAEEYEASVIEMIDSLHTLPRITEFTVHEALFGGATIFHDPGSFVDILLTVLDALVLSSIWLEFEHFVVYDICFVKDDDIISIVWLNGTPSNRPGHASESTTAKRLEDLSPIGRPVFVPLDPLNLRGSIAILIFLLCPCKHAKYSRFEKDIAVKDAKSNLIGVLIFYCFITLPFIVFDIGTNLGVAALTKFTEEAQCAFHKVPALSFPCGKLYFFVDTSFIIRPIFLLLPAYIILPSFRKNSPWKVWKEAKKLPVELPREETLKKWRKSKRLPSTDTAFSE
ncbi:unnamed protein product, partial [Mesorhabditis belari]|uniref:Uncharacterized protein n=1 Tax=Mesorhabditis belari TaxID=2138241 RepID=A0AAF3J1V6_9BILA